MRHLFMMWCCWHMSRSIKYIHARDWIWVVCHPMLPHYHSMYVKLTFEMLIVRGNSIHFWHTNGCPCESVKVFEKENVSAWEELEPPTFGFMRNALTIRAIRVRHLLSHVLNTGSGGIDIFLSKATIWNVNCARATAFIFDTRTDVFVKVSKFFLLRWYICIYVYVTLWLCEAI